MALRTRPPRLVPPVNVPESASAAPVSFDDWTRPHLDCMHRAARRILGCDDLAWDAVQETLLRFWSNDRETPAAPRAALLAVVVPKSLQLRRAALRRQLHEHRTATVRPTPDPHCDDPRCVHERREFRRELRRLVDDLPATCRESLILRTEEGLDYQGIAARTRVPIGTVRSRLARARELLGAALGTDEKPASGPNSTTPSGIHPVERAVG